MGELEEEEQMEHCSEGVIEAGGRVYVVGGGEQHRNLLLQLKEYKPKPTPRLHP